MNAKIECLLFVTALVPVLSSCNLMITGADSTVEHREPFTFTKPVAARNELSISNINGSVTIIGVDTLNEVHISGYKIARDETLEEAKQRVAEIRVELMETAATLSIRSVHPNSSGNRQYRVDYEIRVPSSWKVALSNLNGTVSILKIKNTTKATISNGTLEMRDIEANVEGSVSNGRIAARVFLPENGSCALGTLNGTVALQIPRSTSAAVTQPP